MKTDFPNEEIKKKCQHYRLNASEFAKIQEVLGRDPRSVEWALFSALWNEHCSYKSSKIHLRKFADRNSRVLEAEGENAGVIDLGQGEKIAFKMESHNHPSFIEPYQGAATGVGGILRDIFTMGARPIALADFLCFGQPKADRMKSIVEGVISGISGYGNCVGVPTVTGQTEFDPAYDKNVLVNAMAIGLFTEGDPMALSKAHGPGNWVVYVGAKTGKDGVHGASMASESFDENSDAKKPNVQIGDPFYEKLLIEACLEILKQDLVVAMQDMGAAGLTSSSFEMSSKGGVGMIMNLDQVPLRDASLTPEEILLSESQERMLLVCEPKKFEAIQSVFARWGLEATRIGEITRDRRVVLRWHGETLTDLDPDLFTENAPKYERPYKPWSPHRKVSALTAPKALLAEGAGALMSLMGDVRMGSKQWIYRQYDQRVGLRTARDARESIAFLRLPSGRGLSIAVGCRPSLMRMDAQIGAYDAIFYPALQMALKGSQALAVTDCLNFGNPERIEVMTEFVTSVEALADAAKWLDAPVVSGNVSFYNETLGKGIPPTPATGLIGWADGVENLPYDQFQSAGEKVYLLATSQIRSFHRVAEILGEDSRFTGEFSPAEISSFIKSCLKLAGEVPFVSSKAVGAGGLAATLAQMTSKGIGFKATKVWQTERLFEERLYEAVVSVSSSEVSHFEKVAANLGLAFEELGQTGGAQIEFSPDAVWTIQALSEKTMASWSQSFGE